jgi:hypothetical protein
LISFPSYGFLLATDPADSDRVIERFREDGISAARVGRFHERASVDLVQGAERYRYWDLHTPLTGLGNPPAHEHGASPQSPALASAVGVTRALSSAARAALREAP